MEALRMMKFSADRYKMIDCILFGEVAIEFSKNAKYGYVVAMKQPVNIEKECTKPLCIKVKSLVDLLLIGKAKDYGIWEDPDWIEFLNVKKSKKCSLHLAKEQELVFQKIKAQRPCFRSDYVNSGRVKKIKNFEKRMLDPLLKSGFAGAKIEQNNEKMSSKEKRKNKRKVLFEKKELDEYLDNRRKIRTKANQLDAANLKWQETDFIKKHNMGEFIEVKIPKEKAVVSMLSEEPTKDSISHYSNLCK